MTTYVLSANAPPDAKSFVRTFEVLVGNAMPTVAPPAMRFAGSDASARVSPVDWRFDSQTGMDKAYVFGTIGGVEEPLGQILWFDPLQRDPDLKRMSPRLVAQEELMPTIDVTAARWPSGRLWAFVAALALASERAHTFRDEWSGEVWDEEAARDRLTAIADAETFSDAADLFVAGLE